MSFLAGIGELLKQYSAGSATPANGPTVELRPADVEALTSHQKRKTLRSSIA
jgi:hypothetical protein